MYKYLVIALLFVATPALASAYAPVDGKCFEGDKTVYNTVTLLPESCLLKADVDKANADAEARRVLDNVISIAQGVSVLTTLGIIEWCPTWFPKHMGCVVDKSMFVRFVN